MSNSLFLVEYAQTSDGKLLEETVQVIEQAFIDERLLEKINDTWGFDNAQIFEEADSNEFIDIKYLNDDNVYDIYRYFLESFQKLIVNASDKLNSRSKGNAITTNISSGSHVFDYSDVEQFRVLANLIAILKIKTEKYNGIINVFLKVG